MSHLIGLEVLQRYKELFSLPFDVADTLPAEKVRAQLMDCQEWRALLFYEEGDNADTLEEAATRIRQLAEDVHWIADTLEGLGGNEEVDDES